MVQAILIICSIGVVLGITLIEMAIKVEREDIVKKAIVLTCVNLFLVGYSVVSLLS